MFRFLKEKLRSAVGKFSRDAQSSAVPQPAGDTQEEPIEPIAGGAKHPAADIAASEPSAQAPAGKAAKESKEPKGPAPVEGETLAGKESKNEPRPGLFRRIRETVTSASLSDDRFDELFSDLEVAMLENNVALETVDRIRSDMKAALVKQRFALGRTREAVTNALRSSLQEIFLTPPSLTELARGNRPFVVMFVGVNGAGKTTTIAKLASMFRQDGFSCVIAAADTFRAAAIQQLEEHANRLQIRLIRHDYGSDPAAVAFDAVKYAKAKNIDVVLIDTAGRQHKNENLMAEMQKMVRVAKPSFKLFVGESITGNDCVEQARSFDNALGIDGLILTKADVDEKGGAAISVSHVTKKPILFLGTGQGYADLERFEAEKILSQIGL